MQDGADIDAGDTGTAEDSGVGEDLFQGFSWTGLDEWLTPPGASDPRCAVASGVVKPEGGPFLNYQPCGPGCEVASFEATTTGPLGLVEFSVDAEGHALIAGSTFGFATDRFPIYHEGWVLVDLSENRLKGSVVVAAREEGWICGVGPLRGEVETWSVAVQDPTGQEGGRVRLVHMEEGGPVWNGGWVDTGFGIEDGCRAGFTSRTGSDREVFVGCSSGLYRIDPTASEALAELVYPSDGPVVVGVGNGDTLAFVEMQPDFDHQLVVGRPRAVGWEFTAFGEQSEGLPCILMSNRTHLSYLSGTVLERLTICDTFIANPVLNLVDRTTGARRAVQLGEVRHVANSSSGHFMSDRFFTALVGYDEDGIHLVVVRLEDGAVRVIPHNDGANWVSSIVDDSYLYVGERDMGASLRTIPKLYRFDLNEFEQLGRAGPI